MPQIAKLIAIRPSTTPMTAWPSQLRGGFANTSKHEHRFVLSGERPNAGPIAAGIIGTAPAALATTLDRRHAARSGAGMRGSANRMRGNGERG